jgi:hypothetical protein
MTKMYVTKTADDLYHVEVRDPFTHEEVSLLAFPRSVLPWHEYRNGLWDGEHDSRKLDPQESD